MNIINSFSTPNTPEINNLTTKILTRFNLDQLILSNLSKLNREYVMKLKNPNKNSCLLTKLEILEKILEAKGTANTTISAYISELKDPKRENIGVLLKQSPPPPPPPRVPTSNKKIESYKKIHLILMNYLENNSNEGILKWKSQDNHNMTAKIKKTELANNTQKKYKNNDILKIPVVEMVNSITEQKQGGRVSIYSKELTIDNVPIKKFFINNGLSENFVNTLFPSPPPQ